MAWTIHADPERECREVRPGTLGYQLCWLPTGHAGLHKSQDLQTWGDDQKASRLR